MLGFFTLNLHSRYREWYTDVSHVIPLFEILVIFLTFITWIQDVVFSFLVFIQSIVAICPLYLRHIDPKRRSVLGPALSNQAYSASWSWIQMWVPVIERPWRAEKILFCCGHAQKPNLFKKKWSNQQSYRENILQIILFSKISKFGSKLLYNV